MASFRTTPPLRGPNRFSPCEKKIYPPLRYMYVVSLRRQLIQSDGSTTHPTIHHQCTSVYRSRRRQRSEKQSVVKTFTLHPSSFILQTPHPSVPKPEATAKRKAKCRSKTVTCSAHPESTPPPTRFPEKTASPPKALPAHIELRSRGCLGTANPTRR